MPWLIIAIVGGLIGYEWWSKSKTIGAVPPTSPSLPSSPGAPATPSPAPAPTPGVNSLTLTLQTGQNAAANVSVGTCITLNPPDPSWGMSAGADDTSILGLPSGPSDPMAACTFIAKAPGTTNVTATFVDGSGNQMGVATIQVTVS